MQQVVLRSTLIAYATLLIGPAAALLPGNEWALLIAGCGLGAVVSIVATDIHDPVAFVSTPSKGLAGSLAPLVWLVPAITRAESAVEVFLSPWFLGATGAVVWLIALLIGYEIRQDRLQERLTTIASFEAGPPERVRQQTKYAVSALLIMTGMAVIGIVALGGDAEPTTYVWMPALLPVWLNLFGDRKQSVDITHEGIFAQGTLHEWETIDGYGCDEDALEITRTNWYRSTMQFDVEHIEDIETVTDALDQYV